MGGMNHLINTRGAPAPGLGIDIGRVLMCPTTDDGRPDTSFLSASDSAALATPAAPHAFEVIAELVPLFRNRVWLVSKAGPRIEGMTRRWLAHHRFFERCALPASHVRFCRRREDKRVHAVELGITHFIDDRRDVLQHLVGVVPALYLFGVQTERPPSWVTPVAGWRDVRARLVRPGVNNATASAQT